MDKFNTTSRRGMLIGAAGVASAGLSLGSASAAPGKKPRGGGGKGKPFKRPAIVLVHGFWGGAAHWAKVIVQLKAMGYDDIHAVENPLTSLSADAARTRQMIAQRNGPVILVGHSYGGMVITEAGDQPNVVGLVYIAAFGPDVGESIATLGAGGPPPPGIRNVVPDSDGYLWIPQDKFRESFCQDLGADEALVMAVTQKAPVGSTAADKATSAAWKTKPVWYQVSSEDRMIPPAGEAQMAARMRPKKTITLKASHASLASHPIEVAALIDEAARATAKG